MHKIDNIKNTKTKSSISASKLIPNLITIIGLTIGLSSIRFALEEKWEYSVVCILIAAFFDGLDGRIARFLNATSKFGAELDSLSDLVNFGVCPAILIYLWSLYECKVRVLSWLVVVFFVICMAIRLARFNTIVCDGESSDFHKKFFVGIPAPAAAILALMPIILEMEVALKFNVPIKSNFLGIIIYFVVVGILTTSTIPTFGIKSIKLKPKYIWFFLVSFSLVAVTLMVYPWRFLPFLCMLYLCSIPVSTYIVYRRDFP